MDERENGAENETSDVEDERRSKTIQSGLSLGAVVAAPFSIREGAEQNAALLSSVDDPKGNCEDADSVIGCNETFGVRWMNLWVLN